uniref:AIG1-type G domain-containing protein n=1 Tax=Sinocyclocheilus rhinocerous TaxID=307959 RepID=A0A673JW22_9TELE
ISSKTILNLSPVILGRLQKHHLNVGKSSTKNTILGREEIDLTHRCVKRHGEVADRHITVIEAPGWWRSYTVQESSELLKQEILLSVSLFHMKSKWTLFTLLAHIASLDVNN